MDFRVTKTFDELLKAFYHSKAQEQLLVDDNGITRREGFIDNIEYTSYFSSLMNICNG